MCRDQHQEIPQFLVDLIIYLTHDNTLKLDYPLLINPANDKLIWALTSFTKFHVFFFTEISSSNFINCFHHETVIPPRFNIIQNKIS